MASSNIRIESVRLIDFKNVINGEVEVTDEKGLNNASVLGVYGQNGSGKTAIVDAIKILKSVLCGWSLNKLFAEYINVDANRSRFEYAFLLNDNINSRIIHIDYSFEISKIEKDKESAEFHENNERNEYVVQVFNESVKFSVSSNDFNIISKKQDLVLTNSEDAFGPRTKYDLLTNKNKEVELNLIVAKKYAQATSRSFIFCKEFLNIFQENCQDELYKFILSSLSDFGKRNLFVIETANTALTSLDALLFNFNIKGINNRYQVGQIFVPLDDNAAILEEAFNVVEKIINNMNTVLDKLIPGLTIKIINNGKVLLGEGKNGCRVQLLSHRDGKDIPLRYESEGTKKIIAILQLLINMYNNSSTTVVIDELDAGVFEYLLGELLSIIVEKGKGQLLFTSHNLRPLETIGKSCVIFTTINPHNRYIRMLNVKATNNLRDFYRRESKKSTQCEKLYNTTNNSDIMQAFEEAGNN